MDKNNNNNNWLEFNLNPFLTENLSKTFKNPTEIQKKVLIYTTSKTDLIIQARTGEGKTLCYAIPILNYILNFYSRSPEMIKKISPVSLILVPTHELGIQVKNHIEKLITEKKNIIKFNIKIACVLGGFAKPKQLKILNKKFPEIIIATPGRIWEIIENEESEILNDLKYLKFFVIDEADRMTQTGHFKELKNIINHVYNKIEVKKSGNKEEIKEKIREKIGKDEDMEENKKLAESLGVDEKDIETVDPLDLIGGNDVMFEEINDEDENEEVEDENEEIEDENEENENKNENENFEEEENENDENEEIEDEKEENNENNNNNNNNNINNKNNNKNNNNNNKNTLNIKKYKKEKTKETEDNIEFENIIKMRTILCSATIDSIHKNKNTHLQQIQFQNLLKNLKFYNKLLYIKLKSSENLLTSSVSTTTESSILPSKLSIESYKCSSSLKDYYLYYILKTHISLSNKHTIIFTNSISHTKKLFNIFSYFSSDFPSISLLHSKLQQQNRLKNIEKFQNNKKSILFCTDIGARGLDIKNIDLVIHYHIPLKSEIFVHRSGRTARANKNGTVVSLISEKEIDLYRKIMKDLNLKEFVLKSINLDKIEKIKSLFEFAKEIELKEFKKKKENNEKKWFNSNAKKIDVDFDYDYFFNNDNNNKENEKFLNKKRKENLKKKQIYLKLKENNIKSSSFLTPDQVKKLNDLMKDDEIKKQNLTQTLIEAKFDQKIKKKYKPKQKRYMKRRKGK